MLSILQMAINVPWLVPLEFGSMTPIQGKNSLLSLGTQGVFCLLSIHLTVRHSSVGAKTKPSVFGIHILELINLL